MPGYEFVNNPRLTPLQLLAVATADTCTRVRPLPLLLSIQDTSEYNFTGHPGTTGQGPLSNTHATGFHVHTSFGVSPEGVPLGLLHQLFWVRDPEEPGTRHARRQREFSEKESARWLESLLATHATVDDAAVEILTIADREADIYELFATPRPPNSQLLIRVNHDRRVTVPEAPEIRHLQEAADAAPYIGGRYVEVRRAPGRPPRLAKVTIQMVSLHLHRPRNGKHADLGQPEITLLVVQEVDPPVGQTPIHWVLATTWPVPDLETACTVIFWYSLRWLVERYHYTLKSGCQLEALQLRSVQALEKTLLVYTMVAWRLLWLTYIGRVAPDLSCEVAFTTQEWQILHIATDTTPVPDQPPSVQTAIQQLARLGGHRGWASSGPPGVKVLWRGWSKLQTMVTFVRRATAVSKRSRAERQTDRAQASRPLTSDREPGFNRAA